MHIAFDLRSSKWNNLFILSAYRYEKNDEADGKTDKLSC